MNRILVITFAFPHRNAVESRSPKQVQKQDNTKNIIKRQTAEGAETFSASRPVRKWLRMCFVAMIHLLCIAGSHSRNKIH